MDRMKPRRRYWFWRMYAPAIALWHNATALLWLGSYNDVYMKANLYMMPFTAVALFTVCGACIFTWQYSAFGKYRRRPLPTAPPLRTIGKSTWESFNSWAIVGRWSMGSAVWLLYEHGIGIKSMIGRVFIPRDEIDLLDLNHGSDMPHLRASTSTLRHHSAELRGPIIAPNWVLEIIASYYPDKVLPERETQEGS